MAISQDVGMDEQEPLELDDDPSSDEIAAPETEEKKGGTFALLMIAGLALLLAVAATVFAWGTRSSMDSAGKRISQLETKVYEEDGSLEALAAIIASLEKRLENVGAETVKINREIRNLKTEFRKAFDTVGREIKVNRDQLNKNTANLKEVSRSPTRTASASVRSSVDSSASSGRSTSAASPAQRSSGSPSARRTAVNASDGTAHTVEGGDTFSRIASRYGVSLGAIIEANPRVDPRRLQIGQQIVIPQGQ